MFLNAIKFVLSFLVAPAVEGLAPGLEMQQHEPEDGVYIDKKAVECSMAMECKSDVTQGVIDCGKNEKELAVKDKVCKLDPALKKRRQKYIKLFFEARTYEDMKWRLALILKTFPEHALRWNPIITLHDVATGELLLLNEWYDPNQAWIELKAHRRKHDN